MKKIDLKNSVVFTPKMVKASFGHLGEEVIFSNYADFSVYTEGTLGSVTVSNKGYYPYATDHDCQCFDYFIPKHVVAFVEEPKKKKPRPFKNITEFSYNTCCEVLGVDEITIRNKNTQKKYILMYIGCSDEEVHLGGYIFTFGDLFKNYEFLYNDEWRMLGVEE